VTEGFALGDIVAALASDARPAPDAELLGDPTLRITRIGPLGAATGSTVAFLANPLYRSQLPLSAAGCVIVAPALADEAAAGRAAVIRTAQPYLYFARLTQWWARTTRAPVVAGVHPSAVVDATALVAATAAIGPLAVVEAGAVIGERVVVGAQTYVGAGARLGDDTRLAARVVVGSGCVIGARGLLHSGVVIGADGFGFAPDQGRWEKIEQLGAVRIGDDVEIGANSCVDRGALDDTVIEDGVKLDNLVQIAHNVRVGAHAAMAGCVGIAGSTTIGAHCTLGGGAIVLGHLTLADHVHVSAATVISRSIRKPGQYSGVFPFDDNAAWEKNAATLRQLHGLRDRLRTLERREPPAVTDKKNPP
jgi:UDP-3-O-[3-hydroxymyristoyl] glucosamine N-acyltransferase